jgi:hypothetical protein
LSNFLHRCRFNNTEKNTQLTMRHNNNKITSISSPLELFFIFSRFFFTFLKCSMLIHFQHLFSIHCTALLIFMWILYEIRECRTIQWSCERRQFIKLFTNYVQNILKIFILFSCLFKTRKTVKKHFPDENWLDRLRAELNLWVSHETF